MTTESARFRRLMDLIGEALDQPAHERAAWLDVHCADDPQLLAHARNLVADASSTSLEALAHRIDAELGRAAARLDSPVPALNRRIGPYTITAVLGEGGMGVVYGARQETPLQRDVAIKVIKTGIYAPQLIARFEAERRMLGMLDHPNIAHVFDAGATDDGLPYFAMEWVRAAQPITLFCDARGLDVRQRLRLFRQVLAAVQHAHQKAIVHRDIKPTNVLVSEVAGGAIPKVIDFGVAKVLSADAATASHTLHRGPIGTLEYMSPEQATGAAESVDTRSDIYSLGVLLYELMTGTLPVSADVLRAATPSRLERLLLHTDAPEPSRRVAAASPDKSDFTRTHASNAARLARTLRGDLDHIIGMALRKDASLRYASVAQFADDIDRYLTGLPVSAHPSTWRYRARRFAARHRTEVIAGTAAMVLLIVSTALFTMRLAAERDRARIEAEKAAQVANFLQNIFEVPDPASAQAREVTARQLLDDAARHIETALAGQPRVQASLLGVIGNTYRGLGLYKEAEQRLVEAVAAQRRVAGDDAVTASLLHTLGNARTELGDLEPGEEVLRTALTLRRDLLGDTDTATATTRASLALNLRAQGEYVEAEALARRAVAIHRRAFPDGSPALGYSLHNLAFVLRSRNRYEEAESVYRGALDVRRRTLDMSHPDLLMTMGNLAATLEQLERFAESEELVREVIDGRVARLGRNHPSTIVSYNNLAALFWRTGQYPRAEQEFREIVTLARDIFDGDHTTLAIMLNNLGVALRRAGNLDEAERVHREALAMNRRLLGDENPRIAADMDNLGRVLLDKGDADAAEQLHNAALAMKRKLLRPDNIALAESMSGLAAVRAAQGDIAAADSLFRHALDMRTTILGTQNLSTAQSAFDLGVHMRRTRRYAEAERLLEQARAVRTSLLDDGHPDIAVTLRELGVLRRETGRLEDAQAVLLEARRIAAARLGDAHPETRRVDAELAALQRESSRQ